MVDDTIKVWFLIKYYNPFLLIFKNLGLILCTYMCISLENKIICKFN